MYMATRILRSGWETAFWVGCACSSDRAAPHGLLCVSVTLRPSSPGLRTMCP